MKLEITPIGYVKNEFKAPGPVQEPNKVISRIEIKEELAEGLNKIEEQSLIDVLFYFHRSDHYSLNTRTFTGEQRGLFATRSPNRLNKLGITRVRFLRREENTLFVTGLDAIDGSPVIDLKPADHLAPKESEADADAYLKRMKQNPRFGILIKIKDGQTDQLLLEAGQLHGHYCPGLALGVMAAQRAMAEIRSLSDGMEDLLAIVETNNCFADGVQFVTGCSFGNNALIFKDFGKMALTLTKRDGRGLRICTQNEALDRINARVPEFDPLFQKVVVEQNRDEGILRQFKEISTHCSFETLKLPFDELFTIKHVKSSIPPYAPIMESLVCNTCGEAFMASKGASGTVVPICKSCSTEVYPFLDGRGINR